MSRQEFIAYLRKKFACREALAWVEATEGSPTELWSKCENGAWMCWLLRQCFGYNAAGDKVLEGIYKNQVHVAATAREKFSWAEVEAKLRP